LKNIQPTVQKNHDGKINFRNNPMIELMNQGLLGKVGNGLFVLKGQLVQIINKFDNIFCDIAHSYLAEHLIVPSNLSWPNTIKSEYLNSFKNQAVALKKYMDESNNEYHGVASPTVCYHCFSYLSNQTINKNSVFTALSSCTRNENGKLDNLARLSNFHMREIVFLGSEKYCTITLKEILDITFSIFSETFDIQFKISTASDPFFGEDNNLKMQAQLASESKYEILAYIPHDDSYLSISSFNNHGKIFFKRFDIIPGAPELNFSGCVGWGYERILYAILCQKGTDFTNSYYKEILTK
tara:strand:- start:435 stop:1325 length:891 start_codon:yes stop_codon:yes gene_type:complete